MFVGEAVDRLDLGEVVGVVEVARDRERLGDQLLERRQLEGPAHQRLRRAARGLVEPGDRAATVGEVQQRTQRRHQRHLADVERRARRAVIEAIGRSGSPADGEQREHAAERPADHVHRPTAGVRGHLADRGRDDLLDPVLHAEVAVLERDRAVLHQVGTPAGVDEVLDQRAAAAEVVADRRGGERRHQQDRVALLVGPRGRDGSGRPRAACRRRSACAASAGGRPGRRRRPGGPRCRRRTRPDRASGSGPWLETTGARSAGVRPARPAAAPRRCGARTSRRGIFAPTRAGPMAFARHAESNAANGPGVTGVSGRVSAVTVGGRLEPLAVRWAHVVELVEEAPRPGGDVELLDGAAHRSHPALPVLGLGPVGLEQRGLGAVHVVGVDLPGLAQLGGRPGELGEHEGAVLVVAARDVLLGDEVHPVAVRRDDHDVGGAVEGGHLLARVGRVQVADHRAADPTEVAVDPAHQPVDLVAQDAVLLDLLARRGGDLDEDGVLDVELVVADQLGERTEPGIDALGVVEPVDAEEHLGRVAQGVADLRARLPTASDLASSSKPL